MDNIKTNSNGRPYESPMVDAVAATFSGMVCQSLIGTQNYVYGDTGDWLTE